MPDKRERYNISLLPDTINIIKNEAQRQNKKDSEIIEETMQEFEQMKYQTEEKIEQEIQEYKQKLINALLKKQKFKAQKTLEKSNEIMKDLLDERIHRRREEIDKTLEEIEIKDPEEAEKDIDKIIKKIRDDAKEFEIPFKKLLEEINRTKEMKEHTVNL
jgi:hypothetical protein